MTETKRDKSRGFVSNEQAKSNKQSESSGKPGMDRLQRTALAQMLAEKMVDNVQFSRSQIARQLSLDPRRSIDNDCGFPQTNSITGEEYKELYDRSAVAARAVEVLPMESWQVQPSIFETEDIKEETVFEKAWADLSNALIGSSWHKSAEDNPVWTFLRRVDIQSGIGNYGVLLLGIDDGKELHEPAELREEGSADVTQKLLFLRVFDQTTAPITRYITDTSDPRFGQPETYNLKFNDPRGNSDAGPTTTTKQVHWTRVIHVADNLASNEYLGVPRLRAIYNNLLSLRKLYGGSAEMYWRGAFPGLSIETHPQLMGDVDVDDAALKDEMEQYMNTLQRYIRTTGMTVNSLAPQVASPKEQIEAQLEAICIYMGCPKRIFQGSERGELSSGQDDETWNDRLRYRQTMYITPRIIVPFANRLIMLGVLPVPEDGYMVKWPDLSSPSDEDKATIALQITDSIVKYVQGGGEQIVPLIDFFVRILGMDRKEAEEILESAMAQEEDDMLTTSDDDDEEPIAGGGSNESQRQKT